MRSRAVSLPRLCCASMRASPPPARALARRCSSLSRMSFIDRGPCPESAGKRHTTAACRDARRLTLPASAPFQARRVPARRLDCPECGRLWGMGAAHCRTCPGMTPAPGTPGARGPRRRPLQEALALHRAGQARPRHAALRGDPGARPEQHRRALLRRDDGLQEGQIAEGIKVIDRALEVGPAAGADHNLLGQAHLRQNRDDDAVAAFGRAIETEPGVRRRLRQPRHAAGRDERGPRGARRLRPRGEAAPGQPDRHLQPRRRAARSRPARRGADRLRARARADARARARASTTAPRSCASSAAMPRRWQSYDQAIAHLPRHADRALQPRARR